jgi:hypothetical protein
VPKNRIDDFIAGRKLVAEHPEKGKFSIHVRIGRPNSELDGARWACPVLLDGLDRRGSDIRGIDSLQSLTLAMLFARTTLQSFVDGGLALIGPMESQHQSSRSSVKASTSKRTPAARLKLHALRSTLAGSMAPRKMRWAETD